MHDGMKDSLNKYETLLLEQGHSELWYHLTSHLALLRRRFDTGKGKYSPSEIASIIYEISNFERYKQYLEKLENKVSDS